LLKARAEVDKERLKLTHDTEALAQEREILRLAEVAVARAGAVQEKKLGSISSVDEAREQLARARLAVTLREQSIAEHPARLAALQAALAEAERDRARGELRASFDARIGVVEAAAGDQVQANQTILTLYPLDALYLRAKVPGSYGEELRQALARGERLSAQGHHGGKPLSATLERLAGEADARGVDALLRLNPGADPPLGAFVDLRLERPVASNSIALPFAALHGGDRVFAVREGRLAGIAIERLGEIGGSAQEPGRVLVRAPDLTAGTSVMITHLPNAVDSLKVETLQ
jgi:multidrug efflux pump subunit AcrA (membrane-fusion protein)